MTRSITSTRTIVPIECNGCGITFGLDQVYRDARYNDGKTFYCPNGHSLSWSGQRKHELEVRALQRRADQAAQERDAARSLAQRESTRRQRAERQRAAAKGQLTKTKNRIANGVCPCCNRSFVNLGKHMAGQHPDYAGDAK